MNVVNAIFGITKYKVSLQNIYTYEIVLEISS